MESLGQATAVRDLPYPRYPLPPARLSCVIYDIDNVVVVETRVTRDTWFVVRLSSDTNTTSMCEQPNFLPNCDGSSSSTRRELMLNIRLVSLIFACHYIWTPARQLGHTLSLVLLVPKLLDERDALGGDREGGRLVAREDELERVDAVRAVAPDLLPLLHVEEGALLAAVVEYR